jgi:hypothetical protein
MTDDALQKCDNDAFKHFILGNKDFNNNDIIFLWRPFSTKRKYLRKQVLHRCLFCELQIAHTYLMTTYHLLIKSIGILTLTNNSLWKRALSTYVSRVPITASLPLWESFHFNTVILFFKITWLVILSINVLYVFVFKVKYVRTLNNRETQCKWKSKLKHKILARKKQTKKRDMSCSVIYFLNKKRRKISIPKVSSPCTTIIWG